MGRREQTQLITDAGMSPAEERRIRTVRYVWMMSIRAFLVVLCGVLLMVRAPLLWLWLPATLVGMVALPWLAVLLANDRLPKRGRSLFRPHRRRARTLSAPEHRMIESD
ncbi:DUF3099 domain-containing protein [Glycomyces xiaoerkulensis]|uniref:DUF3099 domain-containing protein n=1 Tax=Glycomyces xiaoerkulensis TaxID=2038139 RepID=UPI0012FFD822|nr:DUF3099 domain-containing protein [Glycomyces xiaoerkulensis]